MLVKILIFLQRIIIFKRQKVIHMNKNGVYLYSLSYTMFIYEMGKRHFNSVLITQLPCKLITMNHYIEKFNWHWILIHIQLCIFFKIYLNCRTSVFIPFWNDRQKKKTGKKKDHPIILSISNFYSKKCTSEFYKRCLFRLLLMLQ